MILVPSFLFFGFLTYVILIAFFAVVPLAVTGRSSAMSFGLQYLLMLMFIPPAILASYVGPLWFYENLFDVDTTSDQRFWIVLSGVALFGICFFFALGSSTGKQYSEWRNRK